MKVFLDTNVVLDFLFGRDKSNATNLLFDKIDEGIIDAYISSGSVYTITYLMETSLKKKGIEKSTRLAIAREQLSLLLLKIKVATPTNALFNLSLANQSFDDLEDAFQYHTAIATSCDYLVTQNLRDFPTDKGPIIVNSPVELVKIL